MQEKSCRLCCFVQCRFNCLCSFPVCCLPRGCLGQDVKFNYIRSFYTDAMRCDGAKTIPYCWLDFSPAAILRRGRFLQHKLTYSKLFIVVRAY